MRRCGRTHVININLTNLIQSMRAAGGEGDANLLGVWVLHWLHSQGGKRLVLLSLVEEACAEMNVPLLLKRGSWPKVALTSLWGIACYLTGAQ